MQMFLLGSGIHISIGIMMLGLMAATWIMSHKTHSASLNAIQLRFQISQQIDELESANGALRREIIERKRAGYLSEGSRRSRGRNTGEIPVSCQNES